MRNNRIVALCLTYGGHILGPFRLFPSPATASQGCGNPKQVFPLGTVVDHDQGQRVAACDGVRLGTVSGEKQKRHVRRNDKPEEQRSQREAGSVGITRVCVVLSIVYRSTRNCRPRSVCLRKVSMPLA